MDKITSFTINHLLLEPGVYVSRKDNAGENAVVTTFDIRMTSPNDEPVMNTADVHTIEHLGATFLRNHPVWKIRFSTSDPWAAVPVFICCWQETILPKKSFR